MSYDNNHSNINPMAFFGQNGQQNIQMSQNGQHGLTMQQPGQGMSYNTNLSNGMPSGHALTPAQIAMFAAQQRQQQQQLAQYQQQQQQYQPQQQPQPQQPMASNVLNNAALIQQMLAAQNTPPRPTHNLPQVRAQQPSSGPATPQPLHPLLPELAQVLPKLRQYIAPEVYTALSTGRADATQQRNFLAKVAVARASAVANANGQQTQSPAIQQQQLPRQASIPPSAIQAMQPQQLTRRPSMPQNGSPAAISRPLTPQHPSVLSTPPQMTSNAMPSPPRVESRRGSGAVPSPLPNNAMLAAVIPQPTPATFQLDESKLRLPVPKPQAPAPASKPATVSSAAPPAQAKEDKPEPRPRPAQAELARRDNPDVREVRVEERKRNEGMRGSMRAELTNMMWAAGDERHPDVNTVDYMEDMVVDFLADLCRPPPPIRSAPGAPYTSIPLSSSVIRHRLSSKPAFRKYLDRFDTMVHLDAELKRNRKGFQQNDFKDLINTVGRDYLEVDEQTEVVKKKMGRPPKRSHPSGLALPGRGSVNPEGNDQDDDQPAKKRKPGPKKGAVKAEGGVGQKPKKVVKRKKEGSVAFGSPAPGASMGSPAW